MADEASDILRAAKKLRSRLCLESECTFDRGCGCLDELTAALLSERTRAKEEQREVDARIVEENQETSSNQSDGPFLSPRKPGNSAGLVYASTIRQGT